MSSDRWLLAASQVLDPEGDSNSTFARIKDARFFEEKCFPILEIYATRQTSMSESDGRVVLHKYVAFIKIAATKLLLLATSTHRQCLEESVKIAETYPAVVGRFHELAWFLPDPLYR